jgi:hypothetical protein
VLKQVYPERRSFHDGDHARGLPGPQPASLGRAALETIRTRRYEILEKSDGERCMFFVTHDGAFLIDRKFDCRRVDHGAYSLAIPGTLLDREMIEGGNGAIIYLAYDCVQFNGTNVGKQNLPERQRCIQNAVRDFHRVATSAAEAGLPFNMTCKTFLPKHLVHQHFDCISKLPDGSYQYEHVEHNLRNGNDGLIFTPVDEPYFPRSNQLLLKWKWFDLNSVDFKVVHPYYDDNSDVLFKANIVSLFFHISLLVSLWQLQLFCGVKGGDMMIRAIKVDHGTRAWLDANQPQHAGGIGIVECLYDASLGYDDFNLYSVKYYIASQNFLCFPFLGGQKDLSRQKFWQLCDHSRQDTGGHHRQCVAARNLSNLRMPDVCDG